MPSNTIRIAKNTLMLYFRQILIMLVSLYTVRVVLNTLGTKDYGIYNVVGGIVVMFSFLNGAMTSATQRFLNFYMGQNNTEQTRNVYSISLIIHMIIALLFIFLAETLGLWFFYSLLNIPPDRRDTALIVYQFSIVVTTVNIIQIPYRATIIAYEKMSFFALISIVEVLLKLGIVFLLTVILFDKLIVYSFLVSVVGIIIFLIYKNYCNRKFETARFRYCNDKILFSKLAGFSGWSIFGSFADVSRTHGINVLLNIFHGVTVNAAMGVATQVNTAVYTFVDNFQTAFRPQIIKSYSSKNYNYFMQLIFQTSKVSFFLLFFFVLPLYVNADFVLRIWLKNVPEYTVSFTRLMLINSLETAIASPLAMSIQATGDIRKYQLVVSCFVFANLPLSLLILWIGFGPVWVLVIKILLNNFALAWRIFFLRRKIDLPIIKFLHEVILPISIIILVSSFITIFIKNFFIDWTRLFLSCVVSTVCIGGLIYFIGFNKKEKKLLIDYIKKIRIKT